MLLSVIYPFTWHPIFVPIAVLTGWVFIIAPLWNEISKFAKITAAVLSYPGAFIIGGWPLNLAPGILFLPMGYWQPTPFLTLQLKSIGNEQGFESALILDIYYFLVWVLLFGGLLWFGSFAKKASKQLPSQDLK